MRSIAVGEAAAQRVDDIVINTLATPVEVRVSNGYSRGSIGLWLMGLEVPTKCIVRVDAFQGPSAL